MIAKLIILGSGEQTTFSVMGDSEGLAAIGEAFRTASEGAESAQTTVTDPTTGQPISWRVEQIPNLEGGAM